MKTTIQKSSYISAIAYRLGDVCRVISESPGLLSSRPDFLQTIGFRDYHQFSSVSAFEVATDGVLTELAQIANPNRVLFYSGIDSARSGGTLSAFTYKESRHMHNAGLNGTAHIALHASGCSGAFEVIKLAAEQSADTVEFCVMSDMIHAKQKREVQYNVMSDAVSGVIISGEGWLKIIGTHSVYAQQFWNTKDDIEQITASYFTFASRCIHEALKIFGLLPKDIDVVIPHNVSLRSWEILSKLVQIPLENIYTDNISRVGHTVSSDLLINLADARAQGRLHSGMKVLGFTYGFGSSWSVVLLEVV